MEEYAKNILNWLQKRVDDAEAANPQIRPLKDRINEITEKIKSASEDELPKLIKLQTDAIRALFDHIASKQ